MSKKTKVEVSKCKLGDLDVVQVNNGKAGSSIKVTLFGGTLYSFVDGQGKERLFLSDKCVMDGSKPVRGGVPLVFPQFGDGFPAPISKEMPKHGFVRTSMWELVDESENPVKELDGDLVQVTFRFASSEETMKIWPHPFQLDYVVTFGASTLRTDLKVLNTGDQPFEFQCLLHTYYLLEDITAIKIAGLEGLQYVNQLKQRATFKEDRAVLEITEENDAIYAGAEVPVVVETETGGSITIGTKLMCGEEPQPCDAVCWNPWIAKSMAMEDFGDEEYKTMLCIEPGCVSRFEKCLPDQSWTLTQDIVFQ